MCNKSLLIFFPKEKYKKTIYFGKLTTNVNRNEQKSTEGLLIATNAFLTDYGH